MRITRICGVRTLCSDGLHCTSGPTLTLAWEESPFWGLVRSQKMSASVGAGRGFGKRRQGVPSSPGSLEAPAPVSHLPRSPRDNRRALELLSSHSPERCWGRRGGCLCRISLWAQVQGSKGAPSCSRGSLMFCGLLRHVLFEQLQIEGPLDQVQTGSSFCSFKTFWKGALFFLLVLCFLPCSETLFSEIGVFFFFSLKIYCDC